MQLKIFNAFSIQMTFQYRERYLGACNVEFSERECLYKFQYRERYLGACNDDVPSEVRDALSFNTANGIWVHAMIKQ